MTDIAIYGVLLLLFLGLGLHGLIANFSAPSLVLFLSGLLPTITSFIRALSKNSLPVYFFFKRLELKLASDTTSKWWFATRHDGDWPPEVLDEISAHMTSGDCRLKIKCAKVNSRELLLDVEETLSLKVTFDSAQLSEDGNAHVHILSKKIEVSYGHAKKKLDSQILPILMAIESLLKPHSSSFELDVEFAKDNPFFAVYIAHLSPKQVGDFKVVLHIDGNYLKGSADKVEISRKTVHLTAVTTNSFRKLAEDFILLSPDTKILAGVKHHA